MENYEPKIIIRQEQYEEYLLSLHRTIGYIAENRDPPNPFRSFLEEGDNLKIVVNDTNDLRFCIEHFQQKIADGELTNVIIGDPHTSGYGIELLDKMTDGFDIPVTYSKDKSWIIIMINIKNKRLVVQHGKIMIEEN